MKVTIDSRKGLKTDLKVVVDKKTINEQITYKVIIALIAVIIGIYIVKKSSKSKLV